MTVIKCISISPEFDKLAKDNKIHWSEAARVGMSIMLSELGIEAYDNKLNIFRKVQIFKQKLAELENKQEVKEDA